jgi:hypothetical protein
VFIRSSAATPPHVNIPETGQGQIQTLEDEMNVLSLEEKVKALAAMVEGSNVPTEPEALFPRRSSFILLVPGPAHRCLQTIL